MARTTKPELHLLRHRIRILAINIACWIWHFDTLGQSRPEKFGETYSLAAQNGDPVAGLLELRRSLNRGNQYGLGPARGSGW